MRGSAPTGSALWSGLGALGSLWPMGSSRPLALHPARALATAAIALSALGATLAVPREAAAQPAQQAKADEAKNRYLKGVDLFDEGDYQSALIEFKRSYELVPNFNVLYNIGQVYFQLSDYANALRTLQQYLDEGGKRIPSSRKTDVEKDIEKLRARVATVTLKINVKDAELRIDDQVVTQALTGPITVSAGKRRFEVSKTGYRTITRTEEIAGQESRELSFELAADATVISNPNDGKPPIVIIGDGKGGTLPPPDPGPPVVPIVLWSITGVLAVGTGVMGGLALANDSTTSRFKTEPNHTEAEIQDQVDKTKTFALVSDVLLGATVAAAGVSTVFTVLEFTRSDGAKTEPAAEPAPAATTGRVQLRLGPTFVGLDGTF